LAIGALAGVVCFWGVTGLKKMIGVDDALDVFGVHAVGGILGALLTGVFNTWKLGGTGIADYVNNKVIDTEIGTQVWIQAQAVLTSVVWSAVVAFLAFKIVDILIGLRVSEESEREGLDTAEHGERAYHV
jgi:Amt family ammonium transporter